MASLHCNICVEEFMEDDRYPVVLPCGHTYICNQCAERLAECAECRFPLTISAPRSQQIAPSYSSSYRTRGRAQYRYENPTSTSPSVPKRLPLPKNVVLMSLLETKSVLNSENKATAYSHRGKLEQSKSRDEHEDSDEEVMIRLGTLLATSACGTYVVIASDGVHIFPSKPLEVGEQNTGGVSNVENEDVDSMVRFFYLDHKMSSPSASATDVPTVDLAKGDRIQIVSIDDGWAKLARGYGYIRCSNGEIAKVGGSVDRACKLEALLRSISLRRKELRREQHRLDVQVSSFTKNLQTSLLDDEDLTVIGVETNAEVDKESCSDAKEDENLSSPSVSDDRKQPPVSPDITDTHPSTVARRTEGNIGGISSPAFLGNRKQPPSPISADGVDINLSKPHRMVRTETPRDALSNSLSCFMGALSFSDDNSMDESGSAILGSCSGDTWGGGEARIPDNGGSTINQSGTTNLRENDTPRSSTNQYSPRRNLNNHIFRETNFRTGLSGHLGMLSTQMHNFGNAPSRSFLESPGRISSHMALTIPARVTMPSSSKSFDDNFTV